MNTYTFETNKWYVYNQNVNGLLNAGLQLSTPHDIVFWYDDYASYVAKCEELNITPQDED